MSQVSPATDIDVLGITADLKKPASKGFYITGLRRFMKSRINIFALVLFAIIVAVTLVSNIINSSLLHVDPNKVVIFEKTKPAGWVGKGYNEFAQYKEVTHWLGTDSNGRDVLSRLLVAGQVSLLIGFLTAFVTMFVGGLLGLLGGYFGGFVDDLVNAIVQLFLNIPTLFILIILSIILEPTPVVLSFIIGLLSWPGVTRLVRGAVLSVRGRDYVEAARAIGAGNVRIMLRHVLPNTVSVVLVSIAFAIASTILSESALSFLGFGVRPPTASWGNMLSDGLSYATQGYWNLVLAPGLMIFLTTLCIFIIADGLRDAFDPRTLL